MDMRIIDLGPKLVSAAVFFLLESQSRYICTPKRELYHKVIRKLLHANAAGSVEVSDRNCCRS